MGVRRTWKALTPTIAPADALPRVHPLDNRHDRHQEPTDNQDPEQREERAELMAPCGLQVLEDGVRELHRGEA